MSVTQYRDEGYLPEAMVNYLARLGWTHGDEEIFSREQFVEWFDLEHLGKSAGALDEAKLRWVNAQHLKTMADDGTGASWSRRSSEGGIAADECLPAICGLFKDRCETTRRARRLGSRRSTRTSPVIEADRAPASHRCRAPAIAAR